MRVDIQPNIVPDLPSRRYKIGQFLRTVLALAQYSRPEFRDKVAVFRMFFDKS